MEKFFTNLSFRRSRESWLGILLDQPVENDTRCQECDGFCCRSFPTVNLTWAEFETLKTLGARRLSFSLNGQYRLIIENGCEFQFQGKCSIYSYRPDICRRFICQKKSYAQTDSASLHNLIDFLSPVRLRKRWARAHHSGPL